MLSEVELCMFLRGGGFLVICVCFVFLLRNVVNQMSKHTEALTLLTKTVNEGFMTLANNLGGMKK